MTCVATDSSWAAKFARERAYVPGATFGAESLRGLIVEGSDRITKVHVLALN
jgi:hypothetical protein